MKEQTYYTPAEIAQMFKVNKATVYFWVKEGKLKAVRLGSLVRISEEALQEFIKTSSKEKEEG
ncbi:MAG: DNA-binding protein [Firmicutes bacterium HGW-Firmicutes-13]|nr:MAG: DNA-binding protein [Firmicutes bacterium HGW-Firmicutes-13]